MAGERRVAMVSGATRGIGAAIARELRDRGYALSLGVRRPEAAAAVFGPDADDLLVAPYDAADPAAAEAWVAATLARFGRIDVLVNNAGIAPFVGLEDGAVEELDRLFAIDVKAPFLLIRAALPALKASGAGRVVNVASLSGKRVMGLNAGYQMAKHALVALTHAVRRLGWEHGIRATALCPGYVATDLTAGVPDIAPEAMTRPEDLARLVGTVVDLPNTAAIAELLVNCRYEHML
ncbi:SDR family NAD(P)-dependent oxidoreductase [Methyloraptor flagellatus]|uniref:SDR family NAD(P)-dependent oxidoreductase n=1 Tax=Methyloraptor flagellatus TaxID=3162530 RepID=A0AAU7XFC4_9HYPH